ncbi:hypothetical protein LINPERPRIM_LOCUS1703 [Linum perenne]
MEGTHHQQTTYFSETTSTEGSKAWRPYAYFWPTKSGTRRKSTY